MDENQVRAIVQSMLQVSQYSVPKVAFHSHNGTDSDRVSFRNLTHSLFITATNTTSGTVATVFDQFNAPINSTITGVFLISNDTTAGNISVYNGDPSKVPTTSRTVATLVKGTTAGAMVGATSLANTTGATLVTVKSDSAGNARVFITFST